MWVADFYWQRVLRVWRIILVIMWWAHKRQTFTLISIKIMWILKFLFTRNRVFKHKDVVSNLHVCSNDLRKMWASFIFHFSTRIQTSTHTKLFNIFFFFFMPRCPTFTFQLSIISKWLPKHISTNVSFKITFR
jgi:hypothetical protein